MQLEPKDLYEKLEFDKVLRLLEEKCLGVLGIQAIKKIAPKTHLPSIQKQLIEVDEFRLSIEHSEKFPISAYNEISKELKMLEVIDYVLPIEGLQRINIILLFIRDIFRHFTEERRKIYPALYNIIKNISFDESLIDAIERIIDEDGNIKSDASPELQKIRKGIISKQRELDRQFRSIIADYRNKGWLSENVESFRNGRRVLSVPAEHKRKIRGIIHDESTTGKTAFIEPELVIDINNDIFELETEEKREIYRILKELSATLRPYVPLLYNYQDLLVEFDIIQAKGRLAVQMEAQLPKLVDHTNVHFIRGFHPLLYLKNKEIDKTTVPFTLQLLHKNRILVLSGPNAGGKSITMKSVGLMQLMIQSGILIPVDKESEIGIFSKIFADIGDQQSLEDDLSTYSSRLENARIFLENADEKTLILIDEFGSGTDPKIGGAIAESIMRELNFKSVYGIITTHYSNLKIFAFKNKGIVNGSMLFDKDTLSPTYELMVGKPGSSYAYEIAQKSGLNKKVLNYARHKTGKNEKAVDELLVELQREKQELDEKLQILATKEQQLQKLIRNYEQLHRELEFRRKKFKLEAKENALQQTAQENKEFEKLIREIKEQQNLEKAKALAAKVREEKQQLSEEVVDLRDEVYYKPAQKKNKKEAIKEGDFVRLVSGGATGQVEEIKKGKAVVQMGIMRMTVKLVDLQHANAPLEIKSSRSVHTDTISQNANFESKIDIRGMRMEEALKVVEDFVDQALITSTNNLRILHGKGNGILRKAVKMKLKEYDTEMDIRHPDPEQGGDGVTLVEIL